MGFKPGGATPASFMSYSFAKRFSKHPESFGKGEIEGVVAPETAAHAAGGASLLPMITLGIPGSPTAAVMLGGLIIWGLQPGPMLFKEKPEFVWGLIASMYTGNVIGVIMVLAFVPLFAAILRVPFAILTPLIVSICAVGAYSVNGRMIDIWYMLIFGVIGYVFKKLDYPLAPARARPRPGRPGRERPAPEPDHVAGLAPDLLRAAHLGGHHAPSRSSSSRCPSSRRGGGGSGASSVAG